MTEATHVGTALQTYLSQQVTVDRATKNDCSAQAVSARPLPDGVADLDESRIPPETMATLRKHAARGEWPFYFKGEVGRGKSYTAAAVYRRWTGRARWMSFVEFCDRSMRLAKEGELNIYVDGRLCEYTRESWWRGIADMGLVVLDEIGSGMSHEWRNETLWNLLEKRKGKPLILTGNLTLDQLRTKFDERVQSRIKAGTIIDFTGRDLRIDGLESRVARVNVTESRV